MEFSIEHLTHLASLALYVAVFTMAFSTIYDIRKAKDSTISGILIAFMVLVCTLSGIFGLLQVVWVATNGPDTTPDPTAFAWLIFDWSNGLAYFAFVSAIRMFLKWEPPCDNCSPAGEMVPGSQFSERRRKKVADDVEAHMAEVRGVTDKYNFNLEGVQ